MRLLITGAGGFLGRYVVDAALQAGHSVTAVVRPGSSNISSGWRDHQSLQLVRLDLRSGQGLDAALAGVDVVIHLAATKSGDLYEQFSGTVLATEKLLQAMERTAVNQLVATSSFAVYEYLRRWQWSVLDEQSALAVQPMERDEYCQTKLFQEALMRETAERLGWRTVILRPGVIYGRDNLWTARLGMQMSDRWWLGIGMLAPLPLTYVENCADAIVLAAEYQGSERHLVLNLIDGPAPSQYSYRRELRRRLPIRPRVIPVPWLAMRGVARLAWWVNRVFFGGTAKLPGLFVPARLHARFKPLRYSGAAIRAVLDWEPRYSWQQGIARSLSREVVADNVAPCRRTVAETATPVVKVTP